MKLISLDVTHWRRFLGGPHRIAFGPRGTLIHGPNETGKSTLFQALRHALFDRPTGTARWLKELRSYGSAALPQVRLVFELDERRLAIEKTFGPKGAASLEDLGGERPRVIAQNMEAAEQLAALLGAELAKGPSKTRQWGAFQWLFMPQDPTLRGLPRIHGAELEALGMEGAATSDLFEAVAEGVAKVVGHHFAEKRKAYKKQSDIPRLEEQLAELEEERRALTQRRAQLEESQRRHEEIAEDIPRLTAAVEEAEANFAQTMKQQGARAADDRELPRRKEEVNAAVEELRRAEQALEQRRKQTKRVEELQGHLDALRKEDIDARVAVKTLEKEVLERQDDLDRANGESRSLRERLKTLRPRLATWETQQRLDLVERRREKVAKLNEQLASLREDLSVPAPDAADMERIHGIAVEIEVARSAAPVLQVLQDDADLEVLVDGEPLDGAEGSARGDVLVRIPGRDEGVRIRRADVGERLADLEETLRGELAGFGVETREALAALAELRRKKEQELHALEGERRGVLAENTPEDLDTLATTLRERLREEEPVPPEEGERLAGDVQGAEKELERLEARRQELAQALDERGEALKAANCAHRDVQERIKTAEATLGEARRHLEEDRDRAGSTVKLEKLCEEAKHLSEQRRELYERLRDEALTHRRDAEVAASTAKRRLENARIRLRDAENTLAALVDRLDQQAAEGLGSRLDTVERRIEEETERLRRLERRAQAALHLESVMDAVRRETFAAVTAPVRTKTAEYLAFVTTGRYHDVALGDDLCPSSLAGSHHALERYDDGSEGLRELTNVLLRVAVAAALCADGPQTLVLDDPCVHVSGRRTRRLVELFNRLMAEVPLQLVLFTHRPEEFDGLDAVNVDIQRDLTGLAAADSREETGASS